MRVLRVSDDDYWKDFPGDVTSLTPRLLATDFQLSRPFGDWNTYARLQRWQVLQTVDPTTRIEAPYERTPQLGVRYAGRIGAGFQPGDQAGAPGCPADITALDRTLADLGVAEGPQMTVDVVVVQDHQRLGLGGG